MKTNFKKMAALLLTLILTLSTVSAVVCSADVTKLGGEGTAENPFIISTADELVFAANMSNSEDETTNHKYSGNFGDGYKVYYKITADIDMAGYSFPGFGRKDIASTIKNIGGYGRGFYGEIYGGGHVISNLTIAGSEGNPAGFVATTHKSVITDLGLENVTIEAGKYVGAFVGFSRGGATVLQSCYVKGLTLGTTESHASLIGFENENGTNNKLINCYALGANKGTGYLTYNGNYGVAANIVNCYTDKGSNAVGSAFTVTNAYIKVTEDGYQPMSPGALGTAVSGTALTATDLNADISGLAVTGTYILSDKNGFVADEFDINDGFPVLEWQNDGLVKPAIERVDSIVAGETYNGYPAFYIYGLLNDFNVGGAGLEYGMKIEGDGLSEKLPACSATDVAAEAKAGQGFIIRVYVKGLESGASKQFTMTPYIGSTEYTELAKTTTVTAQ